MRLIDADEIKLEKGFFENINNVPKFFEWLGKQPTIDPVKHGRWEKDEKASKDHFEQIFICSNCHNMEAWGWTEVDTYKYCPNCGAKMDDYCSYGERREDEL